MRLLAPPPQIGCLRPTTEAKGHPRFSGLRPYSSACFSPTLPARPGAFLIEAKHKQPARAPDRLASCDLLMRKGLSYGVPLSQYPIEYPIGLSTNQSNG